MGDIEVFYAFFYSFLLGLIIYNLITYFFWWNLNQRFGTLKATRRDYYECGFRPQNQKPIELPIQFFLITVFFLMYDIELVFLFPLNAGLTYLSLFDFIIIIFFFFFFIITLSIDYNKHALNWQY